MASPKLPVYNSSRIQRALRSNVLESARLQQTLRSIEQVKLHQRRLINRDMRLISMSIGYIQSCSGHIGSERVSDGNKDTEKAPCFMYGDRIWSRRRKRLQRSTSALELSTSEFDSNNSVAESKISIETKDGHAKHRPFSVSGLRTSLNSDTEQEMAKHRQFSVSGLRTLLNSDTEQEMAKHRQFSVSGLRTSLNSDTEQEMAKHRPFSVSGLRTWLNSEKEQEMTKHRPFSVSGLRTSLNSNKEQEVTERCVSEQDLPSRSGASTPKGRVTPHQAWEDDVSEVTKKILLAQTRAQSGKRRSVYESSVEVMSSQASRNVRGLLRKIKITATPVV